MARELVKIRDVVNDAEFDFFANVIKHFPKTTTGDSDPGVSTAWTIQNEEMIVHWWRYNASEDYDLELSNGTIMKGDTNVEND